MYKVLNMALCAGRHSIPQAKDGAIFESEINPLDMSGMAETATLKLADCQHLNLYVTGLSVALVEVINVCLVDNISLTLWHFDRETEDYYPQRVNPQPNDNPICISALVLSRIVGVNVAPFVEQAIQSGEQVSNAGITFWLLGDNDSNGDFSGNVWAYMPDGTRYILLK
jgi:hypothetical protein